MSVLKFIKFLSHLYVYSFMCFYNFTIKFKGLVGVYFYARLVSVSPASFPLDYSKSIVKASNV